MREGAGGMRKMEIGGKTAGKGEKGRERFGEGKSGERAG